LRACRVLCVCWDDNPSQPSFQSSRQYYRSKALEIPGVELVYRGPFRPSISAVFRNLPYKLAAACRGRTYLFRYEPSVLKGLAQQIHQYIRECKADAVFTINPVIFAYLDCSIAQISWHDSVIPELRGLYSFYAKLLPRSFRLGIDAERRALSRDQAFAFYESRWAEHSARLHYGLPEHRTAVLTPFPNVEEIPRETVLAEAERRSADCCKLLFVGYEWERKGGPIAVAATNALNEAGVPAELHVVGPRKLPLECAGNRNIRFHGVLRRSIPHEAKLLHQLFSASHFVLLPTSGDCTPNVLCEASLYGVPSIARNVGGVSSLVDDGKTGFLVPPDGGSDIYAQAIKRAWGDRQFYLSLARASRAFYESNISLTVSRRRVEDVLRQHYHFL